MYLTSVPGDDPMIVEGYFAAPPERVYNAWTDPNVMLKWFGIAPNSMHSADLDVRLGGKWSIKKADEDDRSTGFEGEYLEIEPNRRLVFSWQYVVESKGGEREVSPASKVELDFAEKGSGTYLTLVHSGVKTRDARLNIRNGWEASFTSLVALMESGA